MPHYRDGQEARAGDLVAGESYNLGGRMIVGTVLEVIPGAESCNLRVAFAEVSTRPDETVGDRDSSHTSDTPRIIKPGYDYGETKSFA